MLYYPHAVNSTAAAHNNMVHLFNGAVIYIYIYMLKFATLVYIKEKYLNQKSSVPKEVIVSRGISRNKNLILKKKKIIFVE